MSGPSINGHCAPGFERVRDSFVRTFADGAEVGASLAVVSDGELLVDLWGGWSDAGKTKPWQRNTVANVWSTTKGVVALCFAMLVDRGKIPIPTRLRSIGRNLPRTARATSPSK